MKKILPIILLILTIIPLSVAKADRNDLITSPLFLNNKGQALITTTFKWDRTRISFSDAPIPKIRTNTLIWSEELQYGIMDDLTIKMGFDFDLMTKEDNRSSDLRTFNFGLDYRPIDVGVYAMTFGLNLGTLKQVDISISQSPRVEFTIYNGFRVSEMFHTSLNFGAEYILQALNGNNTQRDSKQEASWDFFVNWVNELRIIDSVSMDFSIGYKTYQSIDQNGYSNGSQHIKDINEISTKVGLNYNINTDFTVGIFAQYDAYKTPKLEFFDASGVLQGTTKVKPNEVFYGINFINRF